MRCFGHLLIFSTFAFLPIAASADIAVEANQVLLDAIKAQKSSPPLAARALAIFHLASWQSLNKASAEISDDALRARVLGALVETGTTQFPNSVGTIEKWAFDHLPRELSLEERESNLSEGRLAAQRLFKERQADLEVASRADPRATDVFIEGAGFPFWSPPVGKKALHPQWGSLTPMVVPGAALPLLPEPTSAQSDLFKHGAIATLAWGGHESAIRTEYQQKSAIFWAQNAGSVTPPGQWNRIAQMFSEQSGFSLRKEAKLFAVLNVSLMDASIACWKYKYLYRSPRPDAAISSLFGVDWQPLLQTPPHPEYPSGHSAFSAAAALVLEEFRTNKHSPAEVTSEDVPGEVRQFSSFSAAAAEAGQSRIFGGIHFEHSNQAGQLLGRKVAQIVLKHFTSQE